MAQYKTEGLQEYQRMLSQIESAVQKGEIAEKVVYGGAGVLADAIRAEIEDLPLVDHRKRGSEAKKLDGITSMQKKGLLDSLGIAKVRLVTGVYDTKVGFDGYNGVSSKSWPLGQANVTIARSLESGTSFRKKNPFIKRAVRKAKPEAERVMVEIFDEKFDEVKHQRLGHRR